MEDAIIELLGRYTIEAGLMILCGFVAYKLGNKFIEKHFEHIEALHDQHREERKTWVHVNKEMADRFVSTMEHFKEQFAEFIEFREDMRRFTQKRK